MAAQTKVIARSEWLGFPPVCARTDRMGDADLMAFTQAILRFDQSTQGRAALDLLQLDGMTASTPALFDGIANRMKILGTLRG